MLNDDQQTVREAAVIALSKMGPAAVPALVKATTGPSDVQEIAIKALGDSGEAGVPGLINALKDTKTPASLRRKAIEGLLAQETGAKKAIPALTEVVKRAPPGGQDGRQLRIDAVNALGKIATKSDKAAVAALDAIAKNEKLRDNQLKTAVSRALKSINDRK
jgi:HEAT repeat protein